jgi:putative ABC transport system ATP-binding protein
MLKVRDLTKSLPGGGRPEPVLRGVSFDVRRGESVAILGRSGSGKSTLLSLLALFDRADSGTYEISGIHATALTDRQACQLRSHRFGFVFQRFFLLKHLTAEENVGVAMLNGHRHFSRRERRRRALAALDLVGVAHLAKRRPPALSGGEQQRVAIARALVHDPELILADEPTGALDSGTGAEVVELLTSLTTRGAALVMVTHDRQYAARLDRLLELEEGRVREAHQPGPGGGAAG